MDPHVVAPQNAELIRSWLLTRGGIAVWSSLDMSDPGKTWTTPLLKEDGSASGKPHWAASTEPVRVITSPSDVVVEVGQEVKRVKIALRRGANGMKIKLTDASTKKVYAAIDKAKAKAGAAWYEFDGDQAVIYASAGLKPLTEWLEGTREGVNGKD